MACFDLQAVLPTATADISNCRYKSKHFTYSCTVCDLQIEALGDVHCYLWHGVRGNRRFFEWYMVLIAVLHGVAACVNSNNIEITYSDNCSVQ